MADARDYDFQIEDLRPSDDPVSLCFRAAISDRFPYVRATAPFRKEQFDSSGRTGDQSLTGWWTRGQLSFHKGGGLRFYEVTESEEVLDRCEFSVGVSASEPGSVTLRPAITPFLYDYPPDEMRMVSPGISLASSMLLALDLSTGAETVWAVPQPFHTSTPTAITHATVAGVPTTIATAPGGKYLTSLEVNDSPAVIEQHQAGDGQYETTLLWTHHTINSRWTHLWWVKDRILAQDNNGDLMLLSAAGGTTTSGDVFASSSGGYFDRFDIAVDTPGPIILTSGTGIYAVVVDETTAEPEAPVLIAEMPNDEEIVGLTYSLGHLVIVTKRGVRFGALDGLNLTYGPLVLESPRGTDDIIQVAIIGTSVLVPCDGPAGLGVYEFDLGTIVEPLRPAWFCRWEHPTAPNNDGRVGGVWVGSDGEVVYRDMTAGTDNNTYTTVPSSDDLLETGTVLTAYHRFGTLDPKHFNGGTVRASGDGFIDVYQIDETGTESHLVSGAAALGEIPFEFDEWDPVERLALKFVLRRDPSDSTLGPTFLGYQIRALPVPQRQRILKWPLLLHDVVRLRRGAEVGTRDKALTDLQELEGLEVGKAMVTYTDHRTGETGLAFIDGIEFQSDTPSSKTTNGFGGIAYVSLRVTG